MNDNSSRLIDPVPQPASFDEILDSLTPSFLSKICDVSGIQSDQKVLKLQLGKVLARYYSAKYNAALPKDEPQRREIQNFQRTARRALKAIDALSEANRSKIDGEILYRPPFDGRFCFPEQIDYWEANEDSMKRMKDLIERTLWASEKVVQKTVWERESYNPTKNTPLDHLIQDLSFDFEKGTGQKASRHCYFSANHENYTGQFFDFVVFLLDYSAPNSYHSQVALGKRIRRVLAKMA